MIKLKDLITEGKYYGSADWKKMVKDIVNYKPAPRDLQGLHKVIQWVFDDSVFKLTDKNGKYMMDDLRKQPKLKKLFKEGKLTEGKETLVATGKDKKGNKIQMFKTVRWGGIVTHILKSNGKEFDQYAPNLKDKAALNKFKKDYKNIKIEKL